MIYTHYPHFLPKKYHLHKQYNLLLNSYRILFFGHSSLFLDKWRILTWINYVLLMT